MVLLPSRLLLLLLVRSQSGGMGHAGRPSGERGGSKRKGLRAELFGGTARSVGEPKPVRANGLAAREGQRPLGRLGFLFSGEARRFMREGVAGRNRPAVVGGERRVAAGAREDTSSLLQASGLSNILSLSRNLVQSAVQAMASSHKRQCAAATEIRVDRLQRTPGAARWLKSCENDRTPQAEEKPSDHTSTLIEIA